MTTGTNKDWSSINLLKVSNLFYKVAFRHSPRKQVLIQTKCRRWNEREWERREKIWNPITSFTLCQYPHIKGTQITGLASSGTESTACIYNLHWFIVLAEDWEAEGDSPWQWGSRLACEAFSRDWIVCGHIWSNAHHWQWLVWFTFIDSLLFSPVCEWTIFAVQKRFLDVF